MEENLIYKVGETLLLELDGAKDITYPKGIENPKALMLIMEEDDRYEISIKKVS